LALYFEGISSMSTLRPYVPRFEKGDIRRYMVQTPVKYSRELGEEICRRIANGETLASIIKDHGMPDRSTVNRWARTKPAFGALYDEARMSFLDAKHDECYEIADDVSNDFVDRVGRHGDVYHTLDREHVERSKIRIGVRQWSMSRLSKKYSEKFEVDNNESLPRPSINILFQDGTSKVLDYIVSRVRARA
jgi:hypothetical protein